MSRACLQINNQSYLADNASLSVNDANLPYKRIDELTQEDYSVTVGERYRSVDEAVFKAIIECSDDNWDGYNAKAVDIKSYVTAQKFIHMIPTTIPIPEIDIEVNGNFIFEWYAGRRKVIDVVAERGDILVFAVLDGDEKINGTVVLREEMPRRVIENLQPILR